MSQLSLAFLIAAVVAAAVRYGGLGGEAVGAVATYVAQILSFVFVVLAAGLFIASRRSPDVVRR